MPKAAPIRVLVVSDFNAGLSVGDTVVCEQINMQVVEVAPDEPEAVRQAQLLQPDLVLMDVTVASLSRIDAARQIIRTLPKAKIVFVNSNSDPGAVRTALAMGVLYFVKPNVASRVLFAIRAIIRLKQ